MAEPSDWLDFEIAVADFISAVGNDAIITHDVKVPDNETGRPRQRDVWIEGKLAGMFPTKALVSCKFWNNQLDEQNIDHFRGEFLSSGAHVGIIYAKKGFNAPALDKAKKLGFHCCKLYRDQLSDLPETLTTKMYAFAPSSRVTIPIDSTVELPELLEAKVDGETVLNLLAKELDKFQSYKGDSASWAKAIKGHSAVVVVPQDSKASIAVRIDCFYRAYHAKATLLNGSYIATLGTFKGTESSPVIDMQDSNFGPGWERIDLIPETMPENSTAMFFRGNSVKHLQQLLNRRSPD